jgi:hypothetical protein
MKNQKLLFSASLFALIANVACATVSPGADNATTDAKPVLVAPETPETALTRAMPADAVIKIMGQPKEIKTLKAPVGKAEIWVYKREADRHVDRVEIGSIPITITRIGEDGKAYLETVGEKIQYADLHCVKDETIQLLMFNDHLWICKISSQEDRRYN